MENKKSTSFHLLTTLIGAIASGALALGLFELLRFLHCPEIYNMIISVSVAVYFASLGRTVWEKEGFANLTSRDYLRGFAGVIGVLIFAAIIFFSS